MDKPWTEFVAVKQEWSVDGENLESEVLQFKVEPKDEITIEDDCISLGEGSFRVVLPCPVVVAASRRNDVIRLEDASCAEQRLLLQDTAERLGSFWTYLNRSDDPSRDGDGDTPASGSYHLVGESSQSSSEMPERINMEPCRISCNMKRQRKEKSCQHCIDDCASHANKVIRRSKVYCGLESDFNTKSIHKCEECGKCFARSYHLTRHLKSHSGVKDHKCGECGKCFTHSAHLIRHLKIHSGEKVHKCAECGRCFTQSSYLGMHLKIHSGVKDHKCGECGKGFIHSGHLTRHLKTHSGVKDYKCAECGKCFSQSGNLRKHLKIHSGEKDYKCDECGKCFARSYHLITHLRIHSGEKVHKCAECGKCFTQSGSLGKHLKIHSGVKDHKYA